MTYTPPPEHDFTGTYQEWEERVVLNASHFRVHSVLTREKRSSIVVPTLPDAIVIANAVKLTLARPLIYAVTATERAVCLDHKDWDRYLELWNQHRA